MKVLMFFRKAGESSAQAEDFLADLKRRHPTVLIEDIDPDSPQGVQLAEIYGIVSYPAIIITASDGQALDMWQGERMPQSKELDYYLLNS